MFPWIYYLKSNFNVTLLECHLRTLLFFKQTVESVLPHGAGDNLNEIYLIFADFHHQIQMRCLQPSTLLSFLPADHYPDYEFLNLERGPAFVN